MSSPRARLGPYALLSGVYVLGLAGFVLAWRRSGRELPERISLSDVALVGAATYRTSRLISKEKVATPIRAPFTEHEGKGGPAAVEESPRGSGLRYVIGELLVCPFCLAQWIATAWLAALMAWPRPARFAAAVMSAVGLADLLQFARRAGQRRV